MRNKLQVYILLVLFIFAQIAEASSALGFDERLDRALESDESLIPFIMELKESDSSISNGQPNSGTKSFASGGQNYDLREALIKRELSRRPQSREALSKNGLMDSFSEKVRGPDARLQNSNWLQLDDQSKDELQNSLANDSALNGLSESLVLKEKQRISPLFLSLLFLGLVASQSPYKLIIRAP